MDIPGEKLIIKLWETIADKGIGSLLKPWQIRREGVTVNQMALFTTWSGYEEVNAWGWWRSAASRVWG